MYYSMPPPLLSGTNVIITISNSQGYEFIINGLTQNSHYNTAGPTGMSYDIGYDGLASPIKVGTYFCEWVLVV